MTLPDSRCCHFRLRKGTQLRDSKKREEDKETATSSCHHYPELKGQKHLVVSGGRKLISGR